MPDRCVVFGCDNTPSDHISLHNFPSEQSLRKKWIQFVSRYRKDFTFSSSSRICSVHFQPFDFSNHDQFRFGFSKKLLLKQGVIPSVQPTSEIITQTLEKTCLSGQPRSSHAVPVSTLTSPNPAKRRKVVRKLSAVRSLDVTDGGSQDEVHLDCHDDCEDDGNSVSTQTELLAIQNSSAQTRITVPRDRATQTKPLLISRGTQTEEEQKSPQKYELSMCEVSVQTDLSSFPESCPPKIALLDTSIDSPEFDDSDDWNRRDDSGSSCDDVVLHKEQIDPTYSPTRQKRPRKRTRKQTQKMQPKLVKSPPVALKSKVAITPADYEDEPKYVVFEQNLLALLQMCPKPECGGYCEVYLKGTSGCMAQFSRVCSKCSFKGDWSTCPSVRQMPVLNLMFSAAMLLSGSKLASGFRLFDLLHIHRVSETRLREHHGQYVYKSIIREYKDEEKDHLEHIASKGGEIRGCHDGQCDSPGTSAKSEWCSLYDSDLGKVVMLQLVQSNETKNSANMENEGLQRIVEALNRADCSLKVLVTDRHKQNECWIRTNLEGTYHYFDIWHIAKAFILTRN